MRKFKNKITQFIIVSLSLIIPKKKNLYIYLLIHNKNRFSGNIRSLILYSHQNHPEIDNKLVVFNQNLIKQAEKEGVPVIYKRLSAYWHILRAEHLIIDATAPFYSGGKFSIIQLWHGVGFKNIGLLNDILSKDEKQKLKEHFKHYRLIVATSASDVEKQNQSFGKNVAKITGYPRNDVFSISGIDKSLLIKLGISQKTEKIIAYAPTFRENDAISPFSGQFWLKLNEFLKKSNSLLIVKKHPWDKFLKVPDGFSNIHDFTHKIREVQDLLLISDLLITDYSAVSTDFAITGKPMIFYWYDKETYLETSRSFYYDLESIFPTSIAITEDDLLNLIIDDSWQKNEDYIKSYNNFKEKFHYYLDGNSSKRVIEEIKKL